MKELTGRIYKSSAIVLIAAAAVAALFEWKKLPLSILIGGVLGMANMKGLVWGIQGIFGTTRASGPMILFSLFRLMILFAIIIFLLSKQIVNILGIMIGFTVIFTVVLFEGFRLAKNLPADNGE